MKVKFIDFSKEHRLLGKEIQKDINLILQKGNFILGEEVKNFEDRFSSFIGTKYGVGVNSCTDALFLSLLALDIGQGDEVIVPALTYTATALAVAYTGAKPVFADIVPETYCIDPEEIKKKITKRTKAIIPVHLYGHPADMEKILKIAHKYNIKIIEDCAQAHGAKIDNRKVGSFGDIACFSFYPTKNLGCYGDGGMILTNSKRIYQRLLMLRDYGRKEKYIHQLKGHNSRLDTIQAVILLKKLNLLESWNEKRRYFANYYTHLLKDIPHIVLPSEKQGCYHVYHLYVIRVKRRDFIYERLLNNDIEVLIHYPIPCHLQPVFKNLGYRKGSLLVSERLSQEVLSLPLSPYLTKTEIKYIVETLKKIVIKD